MDDPPSSDPAPEAAVTGPSLEIRPATPADAAAIAAIYNQGIRERIATFETRERAPEDMRAWLEDRRYPFLVAERSREILGWIAASAYRPRACYAGVAEFSVYVARARRGAGVGRALLDAFLGACREAGFWKVLSRVFPENHGSRRLLASCGFREVGMYEKHARLDGAWRDVVIVERLLLAGPATSGVDEGNAGTGAEVDAAAAAPPDADADTPAGPET